MDYQPSDSKTLFKVFDATVRKRARRKREAGDDNVSLGSNESITACHRIPVRTTSSAKACLQQVTNSQPADSHGDNVPFRRRRDRDSSASESRSRSHVRRQSLSPRRRRKTQQCEATSLALKAGLKSTPRSDTPNGENVTDALPQAQDSLIYAFLEEAVKKEKRKNRHSRRHEEHRHESPRESRHHRHKKDSKEKPQKSDDLPMKIDPNELFETFAKLCSQFAEKTNVVKDVPRTQSNKSLQCEGPPKREYTRQCSAKHKSNSREDVATPKVRSLEQISKRTLQNECCANQICEKCRKDTKYIENNNLSYKRTEPDYYRSVNVTPTKSHIATRNTEHLCCRDELEQRNYRYYDSENYPERNRQYLEKDQKFHVPSEHYVGEKESKLYCRPSKIREFDRPHDPKDYMNERYHYYDSRRRGNAENYRNSYNNDIFNERISRRKLASRFDRNSIVSKDDDYKDKYSERERDSGLSMADGESVVSAKSNYFRGVKQEIAEQREAMDSMMQLWKELMRCVKNMSLNDKQKDNNVKEKAMNARDSAAEHLRLWRECMQRYETVARDVGDTDARLKEEINKQRSEMSEMAGMWQECLRRYRDMSTDFNSLKQQLSVSETPSRIPAVPAMAAEMEIPQRGPPYRQVPNNLYGPMPPHQTPQAQYPDVTQMHSRASVPPAWWWYEREARVHSPTRRRSSPDSRGSRERRKHRERERDDGKYKEKSTKAGASRSEHKHKKR